MDAHKVILKYETKTGFKSHFSKLMDALSWPLHTCVSMPDIWCSFNAFVDCDVYFDENIGDKQTGDRHLGKTNAHIITVQKCKLCFLETIIQTDANRERETDRQTDRQNDRQKNRDRERHKKTDRQANRERESESLGKSLLCLRIIILK